MRTENVGPCGAQVKKFRERIKNGGQQKQKGNLGPSAPFHASGLILVLGSS